GQGILGALTYFGLDGIDAMEKEEIRALAMRGGAYTPEERRALLDYCQTDVDAVVHLLPKMQPRIALPYALLRGRYTRAAAWIEHVGVPIDTDALALLRTHWATLQQRLVQRIDTPFGVYEGTAFRSHKFQAYLAQHRMPWRYTAGGHLDLTD